jgi:hypothetical protein
VAHFKQGFFAPKNPTKYRGDIHRIAFRSSWELKAFRLCDENPSVVWWQSEEVVVPYNDKTTGKIRRYFPDLVYCVRKDGKDQVFMAEIKPRSQSPLHTRPVRKKGKSERRVIAEAMVLAKNQCKWEAAGRYCLSRGWKFIVLTEKELGVF